MIRTPPGWGADMVAHAYRSMTTTETGYAANDASAIQVNRIGLDDLTWSLRRGLEDFGAARTDILFLCMIYPLVGLLLGWEASGTGMLPLVFPLASGFALIGPLAAVGLNEMSRRREMGEPVSIATAFAIFRSPAIGSILLLGAVLLGMLLFWLVISNAFYNVTLGPQPPVSASLFLTEVFYTAPGRALIAVGVGVGFLFAVIALAIGCVSFPLLLDRNVGVEAAVRTSMRVVLHNPATMAMWGVIVVGGLVAGSLPLLLGLIVVMPVLGHATWHLYRRAVTPPPGH
ncbi:MAG: DUF2189 domain-containing protein [Proteobacteria bacterium]|nr:DUF2189 domain-containing protein [Pseudomonadota bacterium]